MADMYLPDISLLRQVLHLDPESGRLFWQGVPTSLFTSEHSCQVWATRWLGKEAFAGIDLSTNYKRGRFFNKKLLAHRVVFALTHDRWPAEVDHINGDKLDNRPENLREVTRRQNCQNTPLRKNNSSGVMGVSRRSGSGRWTASIMVNNKPQTLGTFDTIEEAASVRRAAEVAYGYHPNHGRAA